MESEVGCGGAVVARRHRLIPVDASIAPAPDVDDLVTRYAALAERELDRPVGAATRETDAREAEVRRVETPIGRFIAEAMRERLGARIGLLNGGAIRPDRPVGQRIGQVTVEGAALEPAGRYTVALPDFLARGRDGYATLAAGRVVVSPDEGPAIVEVLFEALARGRFP